MVTLSLDTEFGLRGQGYSAIAGVDEVGRGCWAGPIVAAAVIMPMGVGVIEGVRDSKKMTIKKREELSKAIRKSAVAWSVGVVEVEDIDRIGISPANHLAMKKAIEGLHVSADYVLADGWEVRDVRLPQSAFLKGDNKVYSIAAASIVAKVMRDEMLTVLDEIYPEYGFAQHKGYGTKQHREALETHGLTPLHRRSFQPMASMV